MKMLLFMMFVLSLLRCWWSVSTLLPALLERGGCTLLLVLAHGGALRLRVAQFINGVIHIEVVTNGSCLSVQGGLVDERRLVAVGLDMCEGEECKQCEMVSFPFQVLTETPLQYQ